MHFLGKMYFWLSNFLNRRGLRQPDSRPLYEYHATNDEYNNLTQLLVQLVKYRVISMIKVTLPVLSFFALNGIAEIMSAIVVGCGTLYIEHWEYH